MRIFIICGEESAPEKVLNKDTTRSFVQANSKIYCIQKAQKSGYCNFASFVFIFT